MKRHNHCYIQGTQHLDAHLPWPEGAPPYFGPWGNDDEIDTLIIQPALKTFHPSLGEEIRSVGVGRAASGDPVVVVHLTHDPIAHIVDSVNLVLEEMEVEVVRVGKNTFMVETTDVNSSLKPRSLTYRELLELNAATCSDDDALVDLLNGWF